VIEVGVSVVPSADDIDRIRRIAAVADERGIDLIGIQDHPYQRRFLDTWALIGVLIGETERVRFFPDVANLPLRLPTMIAKSAASLDVLAGGRFELGLGAGAFWDAIEAMGGPRRSPGDSVDALEEAIAVIRRAWTGERGMTFEGEHYTVRGYNPGPPPAHEIGIWLGAYRPRMLELVGRAADGWVPSLGYLDPADAPAAHRRIDDAARAAGRDPRAIRRVVNVMRPDDLEPAAIDAIVTDLGFDAPILWIEEPAQAERIASEIAPRLRALAV
jgi:alkanesulfonate monooxygenase SsuD/methylene tetrahydromethanopterin reductase-like flavin-dependent oxidoreductase (luciferase family)